MIRIATIAAFLSLAVPAHAQQADPFKIEESSMMGRSPSTPADKRVTGDSLGELTGVRGAAWWQVLGHCAGAYKYRGTALRKVGDAGAPAIEDMGKRLLLWGVERLQKDRGASLDQASAIMAAELEYGVLSAEDGGETNRPFAVDQTRCRDVQRRYVAFLRTG
ncbi:MAG: hypothetical protein EOP59_01435 [Sphingomonadales bacterium]|nr:MAG: hypothetical protein EOP59_01435 [Sphingomonadales bacterium]